MRAVARFAGRVVPVGGVLMRLSAPHRVTVTTRDAAFVGRGRLELHWPDGSVDVGDDVEVRFVRPSGDAQGSYPLPQEFEDWLRHEHATD